jgi:hypothetical protein
MVQGKHPKRYPVGSMANANWKQLQRLERQWEKWRVKGQEQAASYAHHVGDWVDTKRRPSPAGGGRWVRDALEQAERANSRHSRAHRLDAALQETRESGYYASAQEQRKQHFRVHVRVLELAANMLESGNVSQAEVIAIMREAAEDIRRLVE